MRTISRLLSIILAFITSTSFTSIEEKEILITGTVVTSKWYEPNGSLEFAISHNNFAITNLILKGKVLIFPQYKTISLSEISKHSLTPIPLSESLDKMITIHIDPDFSSHGGRLYVTVVNNRKKKEYHTLLILKENSIFRIYKKEAGAFVPVDSVLIKLDENKEIKEYTLK